MNQKIIKDATIGAILATEMEINLVEGDLEAIAHDLDFLQGYRGNLIYNRIFLKRDKVVTSMFEYKRTTKELSQVDSKIKELKKLEIKVNSKMDRLLKALEHYQDLFEKEEIIESKKILLFKGKENDNEKQN